MMNADETQLIETGSDEQVLKILTDFNSQYAKKFTFPEFSKDSKQNLVDAIIKHLNSQGADKLHACCLEALRILSRDKSGLEVLTEERVLKVFQKHAGLEVSYNIETDTPPPDTKVTVEALKCLCNLIFNSKTAQHLCSRIGCVEGIVQRLKTYKDPAVIYDIKFFDLRMLFLLTALCSDIRPNVRNELHGLNYLIEVLDLSLVAADETHRALSDQEVELCSEVLKILFNITLVAGHDPMVLDEEEEAHFLRLVSVLHDLLLCETATKDKREDLQSHIVNLLTNMPKDSYEELLTPSTDLTEGSTGAASHSDTKDVDYDGKNMEAVIVLLDFLNRRLDVPKQSMKESLAPILHSLCEVCRANRTIRKFCRLKVLPYMRGEVRNLPEEGNSLRNKICKLLTNPVIEIKDLAADLLFVLCKENVSRFVKYTGYGNAAGLLAQRGLMFGGRGADYSSPSEESDTEEYEELRPNINPVTGRWEEGKSNPMAGMTEEEKEYEAMQLVEKLDLLQRSGIIQPSVIGPDGKPRPVEHILELADSVQQQQQQQQPRDREEDDN